MTVLRAGGATDTGLVRATNQDTLLVSDPLYAVADGMGGHAAGEVASATAIAALAETWTAKGRGAGAAGLAEAAQVANRRVWEAAQADADLRGMGTTLVAVALVPSAAGEQLAVVNVGDSRAYRLHHGELEQLTTDHSLVAELVADGQLAAEEAEFHPQRHVLTRALGVDPTVPVDLLTVPASGGDRLLLCSDGLIREVSDGQVASILRRLADPDEAANELVGEARLRGGSDNITVVVVDVVGEPEPAVAPLAVPVAEPTGVLPALTTTPAPTPLPPARPRQRVVTPGVVAFFVVLVLVLAGAAVGVGLYARGTYFVGVRSGTLAVYKGRPGGVLWWHPTLAETSTVPLSSVTAYQRPAVTAGVLEPSLAAANAYIDRVTAPAAAPPTTAAPTTTAPTTAAPTTTAPVTTTPATAPTPPAAPATTPGGAG